MILTEAIRCWSTMRDRELSLNENHLGKLAADAAGPRERTLINSMAAYCGWLYGRGQHVC